ncbi:hypothetical protein RI367_003782 [Sorochytrium milnesiophthora]
MNALRKAVSAYVRHQELLRKKALNLGNVLKKFGDRESPTVRMALVGMADVINEMETSRKWMTDRVDTKTKMPLKLYGAICKGLKEELNSREQAIRREQDKQTALDRLQLQNSGSRHRLSQGQIELAGASHEANQSRVALSETVEKFELQKMNDIKSTLQEWMYSQMAYHARQLEILTQAMNDLASVNFEEDLDEICDKVRPREDYRH